MLQETKQKRKGILALILLFLTGLLIFLLSSQSTVETQQLSKTLSEKILEIQSLILGNDGYSPADAEELNWKLRKLAHFMLFLMLGALTAFALANLLSNQRDWILTAILIGILFAAGDELHQMFVPGRTASLQDVLLDTAGAIAGIAWYRWRRGRHHERKI